MIFNDFVSCEERGNDRSLVYLIMSVYSVSTALNF